MPSCKTSWISEADDKEEKGLTKVSEGHRNINCYYTVTLTVIKAVRISSKPLLDGSKKGTPLPFTITNTTWKNRQLQAAENNPHDGSNDKKKVSATSFLLSVPHKVRGG